MCNTDKIQLTVKFGNFADHILWMEELSNITLLWLESQFGKNNKNSIIIGGTAQMCASKIVSFQSLKRLGRDSNLQHVQ